MKNLNVQKLLSMGLFLAVMCGVGNIAFAADTPPTVDLTELMSQTTELHVSKASAFPAGFDPTKGEKSIITYQISDPATVKIEVLDGAESVVVILVNEEPTEGGIDQTIEWDGTNSPIGGGDIQSAGNYTYRVTATDPNDETNQDIVEGTVQLLYGNFVGDQENPPEIGNDTGNGNDIVNMHNSPHGNTSETGPEALIYLVLPFFGPIVMRLKKR